MTARSPLRVGARASELPTRHARRVAQMLESQGIGCEIINVKTKGDRKRGKPLAEVNVPGLFSHELEVALSNGKIDCAVHSLKDLPIELREGLAIAAVIERMDPREVLVVNPVTGADDFASLPAGSRVGTSSLRRRAQLLAHRGDLNGVEVHGDVPQRLRKVETGQIHAAILSAASLISLGVERRVTEYLDAPDWLPAPGQGALAVQIVEDDDSTRELVSMLDHRLTSIATRAERAFLGSLEGASQMQHMPVAALAMPDSSGAMTLHAFVSDVRGTDVVRGSHPVDMEDPEGSGRALAAEMRTRGVSSLLVEMRNAEMNEPASGSRLPRAGKFQP